MADVLLPLFIDGKQLAIPQASATQDGYLSRDDWVLFSGGTVVPVTSFNTRTGEVVLLEDDVLAALGYVPLNKHGDTMTGPLLLPSANPATPFQAAHKAYVDSSIVAGGSFSPARYFPRTWWLSDFSASGSSQQFTGGIGSGSTTLTLTTSTHDFTVGQGICILGAGNLTSIDVGSNLLVSRITAIAGAVITIADSSLHPQTAAVVRHDDSVAIQNCINAVFNAGGGKIVADAGLYWINGPLQDTNSLLKVPFNLEFPPGNPEFVVGNPTIAISIEGPPQSYPSFTGPPHSELQGQAIFRTNRIGTNSDSSMFAVALWNTDLTSASTGLSMVQIYMRDLTWRTYPNPQISAVDLGMGGGMLYRVVIDDNINLREANQPANQPTHGTFGLRCPRTGGGMTFFAFDQIMVLNYHVGVIFAELFHANYFFIACCNIGMLVAQNSDHPATGMGLIWHCKQWMVWQGSQSVDFSLDMEVERAGYWNSPTPGNDFYDPNNLASGTIRYGAVYGWVTGSRLASNTGCKNLTLTNLNALGNQIAGPLLGEVDTQALEVGGMLSAGAMTFNGQPVSAGVDDSGATGFRHLVVPNSNVLALGNGLISYWKMNETTGNRVDQLGLNTFVPAGTLTSVSGKLSGATSGAGAGSLSCEDKPSQHPVGSFSICGWMLIHNLASPSPYHTLIAKWGSGPESGFFVIYDSSLNKWKFVASPDGSTVIEAGVTATPTVETWYHVAAVLDINAGQIRLRINNGAVGSAAIPFTGPLHNSSTTMTSLIAFGGSYSNAAVDELGWWNRALTVSEIASLYGGGTPPAYPF